MQANPKNSRHLESNILSDDSVKKLQNAGYFLAGKRNQSAVKICHWTKKMLKKNAGCYKHKFYGIQSHRCLQMTPIVYYCNQKCVFCWRDMSVSLQKPLEKEQEEEPEQLLEELVEAQKKALTGFKGDASVQMETLIEAQEPKHVAISLSGEPTFYPKLKEFILACHERKMSTFLVTNGSRPDVLEKLLKENALPTQLYISLTAFDEESHLKINRPFKSQWKNYLNSLELMPKLGEKTRTVLRMTLIRDLNMSDEAIEKFAKLILIALPHYVECKSYMPLGSSRQRLGLKKSPTQEEITEFAEKLGEKINYVYTDEHKPSQVSLLSRDKKRADERFIQFDKLFL